MFVYIMASAPDGILYVGVTNVLVRRVYQQREGLVDGFTKRYGVKCLVHYERLDDPTSAIAREKQLKHWKRAWKVRLILTCNSQWTDLYHEIVG